MPELTKKRFYKSKLHVYRKQETKSAGPKSDENLYQSSRRTKPCCGVERGMPVRKCQGLKGRGGDTGGSSTTRAWRCCRASGVRQGWRIVAGPQRHSAGQEEGEASIER